MKESMIFLHPEICKVKVMDKFFIRYLACILKAILSKCYKEITRNSLNWHVCKETRFPCEKPPDEKYERDNRKPCFAARSVFLLDFLIPRKI